MLFVGDKHRIQAIIHFMQIDHPNTLVLEKFGGPIDFLLHLIQKKEIDLSEISMKEITKQLIQKLEEGPLNLDNGAECIGAAANLLWLKSKMLLPKHEEEAIENEEDFNVSLLYELIHHYRFKEIAKALAEKEEQQSTWHPRGHLPIELEQNTLGIEYVSLSNLANLFQKVLQKTPKTLHLQKEKWQLADKTSDIRDYLKRISSFDLEKFLLASSCKEELIVSFLAVLELMKASEVGITTLSEKIWIVKSHG